jgi:hypothetical protein
MKPIMIASCCTLSALLIACQPSAEQQVTADSMDEQTAVQPQVEAVSAAAEDTKLDSSLIAADREKLTLYKSPTCGCCQGWADNVQTSFAIQSESTEDMAAVKERFGVPAPMQSCHTSVSESGYVFEGHIPARVIEAFMANPPEGAKGLAVPGMPIGSPGMEVGDQFTPFTVYLLTDTGSTPYEQINSKSDL